MPALTPRLRVIVHHLLTLLLLIAFMTPLRVAQPVAAAPSARILHAKPGISDDPSKSGESWAQARALQGALGIAVAGDEIWVAAGVYYPGFVVSSFQLKNDVAIYGGFAGTETSREERDPDIHITVLSGDVDNNDTNKSSTGVISNTTDIVGTNSYHIVYGSGIDSTAILDGFTITGGSAVGVNVPCNSCGGGMSLTNSSPTLANLIFSGNRADTSGGGMYNVGGSPSLTNVTFSGNSAVTGGGMSLTNSSPTLANLIFSGNRADTNGGGVYNVSGNPSLTNVIFSGNRGYDSGGGMYNYDSSLTLTNVTFSCNWADYGGGMNNDGSSPTLTNVTFSGNRTSFGGGVFYSYDSFTIFQNSIAWNNDGFFEEGSSGHSFLYSLIDADPLFVRAVDCGSDDYGDLRLQAGSPAIDAGNNNADLNGDTVPGTKSIADITTDLAGQPRIVAVKALPAKVDMGAYERAAIPPTADAGGPYTANEGSNLPLDGSASSDEGASLVAYAWDCTNDGSADASGTYADDGIFTLRLTVTDNINATGTATTTVTIANVAPIYTPAPNQSTLATSAKLFALGSFADPGAEGSWAITVDWGDNSTPTEFAVPATGNLPLMSHTYANAGTYNVVVTIGDGESSGSGSFPVGVNPLPPGAPNVIPPADQTAIVGTERSFALGSFTDPGSNGPWQVTVNWGDGSAATAFNVTSAGELPTRPHTFAAAATHVVLVTVSDGALAAGASFQIVASAENGAGSVAAPADQTAIVGTERSFALGSFTDPGSNGPWQVTVNWGDGSAATAFNVTSTGELPSNPHTFAAAATYDVLVTVSDGALAASATFQIVASAVGDAGSVSGLAFADANTNGTQEEGELGVQGAELTLQTAGQARASSAALTLTSVTDSNGRYHFDSVPSGNYTLTIKPPPSFATLGSSQIAVAVQNGETTNVAAFTLQPEAVDSQGNIFLPAVERP